MSSIACPKCGKAFSVDESHDEDNYEDFDRIVSDFFRKGCLVFGINCNKPQEVTA